MFSVTTTELFRSTVKRIMIIRVNAHRMSLTPNNDSDNKERIETFKQKKKIFYSVKSSIFLQHLTVYKILVLKCLTKIKD